MKKVDVAAAVILRPDGSFLLGQRAPGTFYPGYWEFPGGKVEPDETPREALVRELHEELGIAVETAHPWIVREHVYEHAHVRLHFFRVVAWHGELQDHVHTALSWQRADALDVAPMLPANAPVLKALQLPAVYGISHAHAIGADAQLAALAQALQQGLRLVQLREAAMPELAREGFAAQAVALCHRHGARVLINGDTQLAWALGADGVHLPVEKLMQSRQRPEFPLVGASCHDAPELARAAVLGADFAVLGPVQATASHPQQPALGWEKFARLIEYSPLPVYALGGMRQADLPRALAAGAQGIAAIRGAWTTD
ncbi:Nudix family hydrolase [Sulfurisoma sediminicola]|uniref:8-oxo-dGTP diphosphatase n=1 Tax=Sulfurisoma sediminicola TaxID=1381557 RepID=A0A497XNY6_9PROT|nr:Nudix family hydrolase [Sulfurisoma sediminicola]RLJ67899.1 8-oxo-dGTP diphosphatase [Sulfurisoma sediminicola]